MWFFGALDTSGSFRVCCEPGIDPSSPQVPTYWVHYVQGFSRIAYLLLILHVFRLHQMHVEDGHAL